LSLLLAALVCTAALTLPLSVSGQTSVFESVSTLQGSSVSSSVLISESIPGCTNYQAPIFVNAATGDVVQGCNFPLSNNALAYVNSVGGTVRELNGDNSCTQGGGGAVLTDDGTVYTTCAGASLSAVVKLTSDGGIADVLPRSVCPNGSTPSRLALDELSGDVYVACQYDNVYKVPGVLNGDTPVAEALFNSGQCSDIGSLRLYVTSGKAKVLVVACQLQGAYAFVDGVKSARIDSGAAAGAVHDVAYDVSLNKAFLAGNRVSSYDLNTNVATLEELSLDDCSQQVRGLDAANGNLFASCSLMTNSAPDGILARFGTDAPIVLTSDTMQCISFQPRIDLKNRGRFYSACYQNGVQSYLVAPSTVAMTQGVMIDSRYDVPVLVTATPAVSEHTVLLLTCHTSDWFAGFPEMQISFDFPLGATAASNELPFSTLTTIISCRWSVTPVTMTLPSPATFQVVARSATADMSIRVQGAPNYVASMVPSKGLFNLELLPPDQQTFSMPVGIDGLRIQIDCTGDLGFSLSRTLFTVPPITGLPTSVPQDEANILMLAPVQLADCNLTVSADSDPGFIRGRVISAFRVQITGVIIDDTEVLITPGAGGSITVKTVPDIISGSGDSFSGTLQCTAQPDDAGHTDSSSTLSVAITIDESNPSQTVPLPAAIGFGAYTIECSFDSTISSAGYYLSGITSAMTPAATVHVAATSQLAPTSAPLGQQDFVSSLFFSQAQCDPVSYKDSWSFNPRNRSVLVNCAGVGLCSIDTLTGERRHLLGDTQDYAGIKCRASGVRQAGADPITGNVFAMCTGTPPGIRAMMIDEQGTVTQLYEWPDGSMQNPRAAWNPVTNTYDVAGLYDGVFRIRADGSYENPITGDYGEARNILSLVVNPLTGTTYVGCSLGVVGIDASGHSWALVGSNVMNVADALFVDAASGVVYAFSGGNDQTTLNRGNGLVAIRADGQYTQLFGNNQIFYNPAFVGVSMARNARTGVIFIAVTNEGNNPQQVTGHLLRVAGRTACAHAAGRSVSAKPPAHGGQHAAAVHNVRPRRFPRAAAHHAARQWHHSLLRSQLARSAAGVGSGCLYACRRLPAL